MKTKSNSSLLPSVVLVGRPNVGKSTLFNRLVGKRQAIVADVAGTTRDRLERRVEWDGALFQLTDMAGLELSIHQDSELGKAAQAQVETALKEANLLVWVVDSSNGITTEDQKVAAVLRKLGKKVIIAVNKADHPSHDSRQFEFVSFGFSELVTLSSINGRGVNELLDTIVSFLPKVDRASLGEENREIRLSIIGRPNVGKSTLLNTLAQQDRSVVSNIAGTTRDMVDTVVSAQQVFGNTFTQWKTVRIVDTAGIRRRGKIDQGIEKWSIMRTMEAVKESEIVLFMIEAMEGMVHQDLQIAQKIVDSGRAVILVVNKWDLLLEKKDYIAGTEEDLKAQEIFLTHLLQTASFLHWIQVLFISAKDQINTHVIGQLVIQAYKGWSLQIDQEDLDDFTKHMKNLPRFKRLQKVTLEHNRPPVFHLHVEGKDLLHFSAVREIENVLRESFKIGPSPIKIWTVPSVQRRY